MGIVQNYKLIEGQFNPSDASNILFALFNSKINFHQLEAFRMQEQNYTNIDYVKHEERVAELKDTYKLLKTLINEALDENMDMEIHGTIAIKPVFRISN